MIQINFTQPFYYISFSLLSDHATECSFSSLFQNEQGSLKYYLEQEIRGIRDRGWRIPKAQYQINKKGIGYDSGLIKIQVLENGHIIIQAAVSEDFLCWANSRTNRIEINATALIEFTYNGVAFLQRAIQDCENPKRVVCNFGFVGMSDDYVLGGSDVTSINHHNISQTIKPIGFKTEEKLEISVSKLEPSDGPAIFSYSIIAEIYKMFGFDENNILYVCPNEKKIDIEAIRSIN